MQSLSNWIEATGGPRKSSEGTGDWQMAEEGYLRWYTMHNVHPYKERCLILSLQLTNTHTIAPDVPCRLGVRVLPLILLTAFKNGLLHVPGFTCAASGLYPRSVMGNNRRGCLFLRPLMRRLIKINQRCHKTIWLNLTDYLTAILCFSVEKARYMWQ